MMAKNLVRLSINISPQEMEALDEFAALDNRAKTEIVRELLRTLPTYKREESLKSDRTSNLS
jgi:metal-responsive CopG/Arc/MetJ family transcriptional regulator